MKNSIERANYYFREDDDNFNGDTNEKNFEPVEIFFSDISQDKQEAIMKQLLDATNSTSDDDLSKQRIMDTLAKTPLFVTRGEDIKNKLGIKI